MQKIHVNRDRQSLGKFTPEEVTGGLRSGEFLPTDLAWREGMETWKPLAEFDDLPEVAEPITAPPLPGEPVETVEAGDEVDPVEADLISPTGEVTGGAEVPTEAIPWERAGELGWGKAFWQTLKGSLLTPTRTLGGAEHTASLGKPYVYYLLLAIVTGVVAAALNVAVAGAFIDFASTNPDLKNEPQIKQLIETYKPDSALVMELTGLFLRIPFIPIFFAGLIHAILMAMGSARAAFAATFGVCCYAIGSAQVFQLLSCCGFPVVLGWTAVSISFGLAAVHRLAPWQAAVAVMVTMLVGCGLFAGLAMVSAAA
ncbi:MAG: DUF4339 domain-containing protein [Chthoniobacterales bacterium]